MFEYLKLKSQEACDKGNANAAIGMERPQNCRLSFFDDSQSRGNDGND